MEKVYDILLIYTFSPFLQIFFISPIQILILIGTYIWNKIITLINQYYLTQR